MKNGRYCFQRLLHCNSQSEGIWLWKWWYLLAILVTTAIYFKAQFIFSVKKSILRPTCRTYYLAEKGVWKKILLENLELKRHRKPKWIVSLKLFPELYQFSRHSGSNFLQYLALDMLGGRHGLINRIETKALLSTSKNIDL